MKVLLSILSMLLLLAGCADPRVDGQLARAEAAMMTAPDSAAAVLDSIEPSRLRGRQAALHALLRTHANYRNYIVDTDDSLINLAVDYYTAHPDPSRLMVAYYCRGRVRDYGRRYPEAMTDALRSLDLATTLNDPFYQARAHELMGDLWSQSHAYCKAAEEFDKAAKAFAQSNKIENSLWSLTDKTICLSNSGNYLDALQIIDSLENIVNPNSLLHQVLEKQKGKIYLKQNRFDESINTYKALLKSDFYEKTEIRLFLSQAYIRKGMLKDGKQMLDQAKKDLANSHDIHLLTELNRTKTLMLWYEGNYQDAIKCQNEDLRQLDSTFTHTMQNNVEQSVSSHYISRYRQESHKYSIALRVIIPLAALLIIGIIALYLLKRRVAKKELDIRERMNAYHKLSILYTTLESTNKENTGTIKRQKKEISSLMESLKSLKSPHKSIVTRRTEIAKELCDLFFTYSDNDEKIKEHLFKLVKKIFKEMGEREFLKNLYSHVDQETGGLATWYNNKFPAAKEFSVLLYSVSGLTVKEMSVILHIKLSTLYNYRQKIRSHIAYSKLPNRDELCKFFD